MDQRSASQYRIHGKIAEGAQGSVYEAHHERMGRRVALKFLHGEALLHPDDRERFDREARIAATLDHVSICPIFDYDEMDGRVFLAMPFLEGSTLRTLLQDGPLPLSDAVVIAIQIAEGLQEAHRHGIIHRDIKPSNIMITRTPDGRLQAKILDFGLARAIDMTAVTRTGATLGTAAYMSPEQLDGQPLDGRTDIWSLGAVLYEMVVGQRAFPGENAAAVHYGVHNAKPASPGRLRPESRPELRRIISQALRRDPRHRYQGAEEMLADLRALRQEMEPAGSPLRDWLWKYRNRMALLGAGLAGLLVVAFGSMAVMNRWPQAPPPLGQPRQITFGEEWEGEPCLSPDGTRVAFSRFNGIDHDIHWVGVRGGEPVPIVTGPGDDRAPCWLPDGSGLLFTSNRGGDQGIWKAMLTGGQAFLVVSGATAPGVAADGSSLAFTRPDSTGHFRVCVADLTDSDSWRWGSGGAQGVWSHFCPSFSPDGKSICFTDYHNVWTTDLAGGTSRRLTSGGTWDSHPVWAPDGRHIYFSSLRGGASALWRVEVDGGGLERLTPGSGPESHPSLDQSGRSIAYSTEHDAANVLLVDRYGTKEAVTTGWALAQQPALAPDASFVVYTAMRQGGTYSLWRRNLSAGHPDGDEIRLTDQRGNASHPTVSPDGFWIAYYVIEPENGTRDVWVVPSAGGHPVQVTDAPESDSAPAWAPDGGSLAFCSERDGMPAIFTIDIENGRPGAEPIRVTPDDVAASYPCWSPDGRRIAFVGHRDAGQDVYVVSLPAVREPVRLTFAGGIHLIRWIPGPDEIWASAGWGDGRLSVRKVPLAGGEAQPLTPVLRIPDGSTFGWFNADASGRHVALTEIRHTGDVWVLEAKEGHHF